MRYFILFISISIMLLSQDKIEIRRTYFENGQISTETRYLNGEKDGVSKSFYSTGEIRNRLIYKDGRNTDYKVYRKDGSIKAYLDMSKENITVAKFERDNGDVFLDKEVHKDADNKDKFTIYRNENGYKIKLVLDDGELVEAPRVTFKNNPKQKNGEVDVYNKDGSIHKVQVVDGVVDGEMISSYRNDKEVFNYSNGKINGIQKKYKDDILIEEVEYKNNQKNGILREYYDDGTLKKEAIYENSKLIGDMIEYRQDGTIKNKITFANKGGGVVEFFDINQNIIKLEVTNFEFLKDKDNKSYMDKLKLYYSTSERYMDFNLSKGDGIAKLYYTTGEIKYIIPLKDYKVSGEAKKFYKNKKLRAIIPLSKDKIEGKIKVYYRDGKSLKYIMPYSNNLLNGMKIKYNLKKKIDYNMTYSDNMIDLSSDWHNIECDRVSYYENNNVEYNVSCKNSIKLIRGYYQNGMIEYEISYKNNFKDGISYLYYGNREFDEVSRLDDLMGKYKFENSIYRESIFIDNMLNGITKIYDKKGELIKEIRYKDNLKNGLERSYIDGELARETEYKNGKKSGREMIKYFNEVRVSYYKDNKKDGFENIYFNGELIEAKEYKDGNIVYEIEEVQ